MELKIEYISIDDIKPYERNTKIHTDEQVKQIKRSITEFGFNDPIAIWNGEIIEGHGRYLAAKELGLSTVPVMRLDNLTDEQRRAYAIVHNRLTLNTGFDIDMLKLEMSEIELDMSDFGFESIDEEINALDLDYDSGEPNDEQFEAVKCPKCGFVFEKR